MVVSLASPAEILRKISDKMIADGTAMATRVAAQIAALMWAMEQPERLLDEHSSFKGKIKAIDYYVE